MRAAEDDDARPRRHDGREVEPRGLARDLVLGPPLLRERDEERAGDVHGLPYADNSFGGYLSFGVLEHFEAGMAQPLAEAYRVLKPGGILVLTIPYPNVVNRLVAWRRKSQGVSVLNDDDFFESTYTRAKLEANVKGAGFEVLKAVPTSHSYTLWGLGGVFRAPGYYQTSALAEGLGKVLRVTLPWAFNFTTLIIGRKA